MRRNDKYKTNWLPTFTGSYHATLDRKGRFKLPAAFIEELRRCVIVPREMVIVLGDELRIYSCKMFDALPKSPFTDKEKISFITDNRYNERIRHDRFGKVQIPEEIRGQMNLYENVQINLLGCKDYFLIDPIM